MKEGTLNKYKRKYIRELKTYTFPDDYYDKTMNNESQGKDIVNERYNRSIIINTPNKYYLNNGKFIYYDSLRELNDDINEWIKIFIDRAKLLDNVNSLYSFYIYVSSRINALIEIYISQCKEKYGINYPIIPDTLIKNYIDILMGRYLAIGKRLSSILRDEFNVYYNECNEEILDLVSFYQSKILSVEEESDLLYNEFRNAISNVLNRPRKLIKIKNEKEEK